MAASCPDGFGWRINRFVIRGLCFHFFRLWLRSFGLGSIGWFSNLCTAGWLLPGIFYGFSLWWRSDRFRSRGYGRRN